MPFIAYGGAWPLTGLVHVYSRLFNEMISQSVSHPPTGWPHDHSPTNVGAMVKTKISPMETNVTRLYQESVSYRITANFETAMQQDSAMKVNGL